MFVPPLIADTVGTFFVVLLAMLVVPLLAEKLRLPGLALLAITGAAIGPFGFGIVESEQTVRLLGYLGLLYAFFLAGAELDFTAALKKRARTTVAGILTVILPFGAGLATGLFLLKLGAFPSILVGAAFVARSNKPYPTVERLGLLRSRPMLASAGGSSLSELFAVAALAVASAAVKLDSLAPLDRITQTGLMVLAILAIFILLPKIAGFFLKWVRPDGAVEFIFVLAIAFSCAFAMQLVGLEPAVGAFLAGLIVSRFMPPVSAIRDRLRFTGDALFLPFFVVFAGMSADLPRILAKPESLLLVLAAFAVFLLARLLSALIKRPLLGFSWAEASFSFTLSLNQGAAVLGILLLGLRSGLVDEGILGGALLIVFAVGIIGPLLAQLTGIRLALKVGASLPGEAEAGERVMVAVSNPATLRNLVELAFLLRSTDEKEAIYPLAIVPESGDAEADLAKAENLLAKVMVQASQAGIEVMPSTKICVNIPEGILQASAENHIRTLIAGWNRAPKLSRSIFGSVIERVIQGGRELVVVARATNSLKNLSRVALLLPPLAERHPGFGRGLSALGSLLFRSGAHLSVFVQAPHGAAAKVAAARLGARGQSQIVELESWKSATEAVRSVVSSSTAFAIFCSRPGGPAWHPAVEKLPHLLAEEFPDTPLILFYLPDQGEVGIENPPSPEEGMPSSDLFSEALASGRVLIAMRETAVADGVRELLRRSFEKDRKLLGHLSSLFTEIAQKAPIELESGVVLLHAHVPEVEKPMIFFGARPEGFRILALAEPARVLVILCAPEDQPPEAHLAVLGEIAHLFSGGRLAERLLAAKAPAELENFSREKKQPAP